MEKKYADYAVEKALELIRIDSPSGFTARAAQWVRDEFAALGFDARLTQKGGVLIDLGGDEPTDGLFLEAHCDTLGAMVAEVKGSGRLRVTNLGGMRAENGEAENVRVYTRAGRVIEGTLQLVTASVHVNGSYGDTKRSFDTTEVVLDEDVKSADDVRALGVEVGDIVCFEPRERVTASGYIKSRFLDDKLSIGILLGLAKYMRDGAAAPKRRVYAHVTVYEEVGHGGSASLPQGVTEIGSQAFRNCPSLASAELPAALRVIGTSAFADCAALSAVTLPAGLEEIGDYAFSGCARLSSVTIPASVSRIGRYAFADCTRLSSVTFENADGWFVNRLESATTGDSVDLTDPQRAAEAIRSTYVSYYWKRGK